MTSLHTLRVFLGPGGEGGNPLGVFLDGGAIAPADRQAVAAALGFSETVFVDDRATGELRIFTPAVELPLAGHPLVGTSWLLGVDMLRPPAASSSHAQTPTIASPPGIAKASTSAGDGSRTRS